MDLIKDLEQAATVAASSWSTLISNSRSRHPIRLSVSVDSVVPYYCESASGSQELLKGGGRDTDEESLNNILDACDDVGVMKTISGSWSALLDPHIYSQSQSQVGTSSTSGSILRQGKSSNKDTFTPKQSPTIYMLPLLPLPTTTPSSAAFFLQLKSTLCDHYRKLIESKLNSACASYYKKYIGAPPSLADIEPCIEPTLLAAPSVPQTPSTPTTQQMQITWLTGPPASGKTTHCLSLLRNWVAQCQFPYSSSLVLYIPLSEIQSIQSYLKSILRPIQKPVSSLLNTVQDLDNLCVILDDVHHDMDPGLLNQVQDVLNGKLFSRASSLICTTSSTKITATLQSESSSFAAPAAVYKCRGLNWVQVSGVVKKYYGSGGKAGGVAGAAAEYKFIEYLNSCPPGGVLDLGRNPSTLLLLLLSFESQLLSSASTHHHQQQQQQHQYKIYSRLVQTLIANSSSTKKSPPKLQKLSEDVGRLLLHHSTKDYYSEVELASVQDAIKCGIFEKSGCKRYRLLHWSLRNYFIAIYLAGLNSPTSFRKEMDKLIEDDDSDDHYDILQLLIEILSDHHQLDLFFSSISLFSIPLQTLLSLCHLNQLLESEFTTKLCALLHSSHIHHTTIDSSNCSWGPVLQSQACPLNSLEIILKPPVEDIVPLFDSLIANTSVTSTKLSSVPGQEWSPGEMQVISHSLYKLLTSHCCLQSLSLHFTLLEEHAHSVYQPFVDVIVFCLGNGVPNSLKNLTLEMDLNQEQLWEIAGVGGASAVARSLRCLALPNLCVDGDGVRALGSCCVLNGGTVEELSLQGCWRSPVIMSTSMSSSASFGIFHHLFCTQPTLKKLNLSKSTLTPDDVHSLASFIRSTSTLVELHFEGMKLVEVMNVLLALDQNKCLQKLYLNSNHVLIGDDSLAMAAQVLAKNRGLKWLGLGGWQFDIEDQMTLTRLTHLLTNWQLETLDLTSCTFNIRCPMPTAATGAQSPTTGGGTGTLKRIFSSTLHLNSTLSTMVLPNLLQAKFSGVAVNYLARASRAPSVSPCQTMADILHALAQKSNICHLDLSRAKLDSNSSAIAAANAQVDSKSYLKLLKSICNTCIHLESLHLQNYKIKLSTNSSDLQQVKCVGNSMQRLSVLNLDGTEITNASDKGGGGGGHREQVRARLDNLLLVPIITSLKSTTMKTISWSNFKPVETLYKCLNEYSVGGGGGGAAAAQLRIEVKGATVAELKNVVNRATQQQTNSTVSIEYVGDGSTAGGALIVKRISSGDKLIKSLRRLF